MELKKIFFLNQFSKHSKQIRSIKMEFNFAIKGYYLIRE